eukprot:9257005-Alexandrium_andersonii.AAC.1
MKVNSTPQERGVAHAIAWLIFVKTDIIQLPQVSNGYVVQSSSLTLRMLVAMHSKSMICNADAAQ